MHYSQFVKDALALAREEELISDQLALTKAAENARKIRANQSRRFAQKEGVIIIDQCRSMTLKRKEKKNRLYAKRQNKADRQQRKR
jgi:hypothetical protein